ncbi:fructose-bisphosphatase class II [Escherichia coli]
MMSLAWPLFRVTEQAALAGRKPDVATKIKLMAVTAMRQALNDVAFRGRVVIGEGEIDHAPMLSGIWRRGGQRRSARSRYRG